MAQYRITSTDNNAVKYANSVHLSKVRKNDCVHFVEGEKIIKEALQNKLRFHSVFAEENYDLSTLSFEEDVPVYIAPRFVLEKICECDTPQHICAVVHTPEYSDIHDIKGNCLILDCVQDPGNVGTMIRTADAFGIQNIIFGTGCSDPYSGKTLRSAMGSTYHVNLYHENVSSILPLLQSKEYQLICGHLKGSDSLPALVPDKTAIIVGNEGNGVSDEIAEQCILYKIPMKGNAESLNASIAAAILIFQATK